MLTEQLVIERGIPLQTQAAPGGLIALLRQLDIGESVLVPGKAPKHMSSVTRAARRGTDKCFQTRTVTTGVRVWRVE